MNSTGASLMAPTIELDDASATIVADTSAVINILATGSAETILAAVPNRVVVVEAAASELDIGRARGYPHAAQLLKLVERGRIQIVTLGDDGLEVFERLTVGTAAATLDDGEAATIGYAIEHASVALIDERKATRICADRYTKLRTICTLHLLLHSSVQRILGADRVATAVFNALRIGRMHVPSQHIDVVTALIGPERAAACGSLPKRARASASEP